MVLVAAISYGQTVLEKKASVNKYLDNTKDFYFYRANPSADAISDTDSLWSYTFGVDKVYDVNKQYIRLTIDKLTGTPTTAITWSGKTFWDEAWTTITTVNYTGSADTTIVIDQSTAKHYRFYKLQHLGNSGTFTYKILKTEVQFYK